MATLNLTPPDAGILRLLRAAAGLSQQELAARLQIHPSRLVAILDNLEKRGFVERRENSESAPSSPTCSSRSPTSRDSSEGFTPDISD